MWLLILLLFSNSNVVHPFPVFTFNGTFSSPTATPSYAHLVNNIDLPDTFILCTSVKQARFDDVGFYVISGEDSGDWLTTQFSTYYYSNETWLTVWWDGAFYGAGKLQNPIIDKWYHICLKLALKASEIEANVNGQLIGRIQGKAITNTPNQLGMKMGLGHDNLQFQGSMTNIRVLEEVNASKTSILPCEQGQNNLLSWSPKNWTPVGFQWSLVEVLEDLICLPSDFYNLAIPLEMTFNESLDTCRHKLNNSIIPFETDNKWFLRYVSWYMNTTAGACPYIWTPLKKLKSEGLLLDINNNIEITNQNWAKGQPNGGKYEKFVAIMVAQRALADASPNWLSCSSCRISNMLLLELAGLCKDSLIGNVRVK